MEFAEKLQRRLLEVPFIPLMTENSYRRALQRLSSGTPKIGAKRTHYHMRAALVWFHYDSIYKVVTEAGWPDCPDRLGLISRLSPHLDALDVLRPLSDHAHTVSGVSFFGIKSVSKGKRRGLGSLPIDWREQLYAGAEPQDRVLIALLAVTGCRPSELAKGVDIRRNAQQLFLGIRGAKVTEENGQPYRVLQINIAHPWGQRLADCLSSATENGNYQEDARVVQHRIHRTAFAWQSAVGITGYQISPYSFRHQLASDLKRQGEPADWIAAVLGHRSTRTATCYGTWRQGKGGQGGLIQTVAVKHTPRQWVSTFQASPMINHRIVIISGDATAKSSLPSPGVPSSVTTKSRSSHKLGGQVS